MIARAATAVKIAYPHCGNSWKFGQVALSMGAQNGFELRIFVEAIDVGLS